MTTNTFTQFLINEQEVRADAAVDGIVNQLQTIIDRFLVPVRDDKKEFHTRMLLGREVIHVITDAAKDSISNGSFDSKRFDSKARLAVADLLNPSSIDVEDVTRYPAVSNMFVDKIVHYVSKQVSSAEDNDQAALASSLTSAIGERWNDLARRASHSDRGAERQMTKQYDVSRSRSPSKRQTYRNIKQSANSK